MGSIRASIRFPAFVIASFGVYGLWWVGSWVVPNKQLWRQVVFHWWARSFAAIARMEIEIVGQPPKPPFFLVCNHISYVDIPALRLAANGIFIAKSEIKDWFLAGTMIKNMGNIFINRKNKRDIPRAGAEVLKRLNEQEGVILFPEGTSTKGETILPFNSSFLEFAASTDLPVSYAALRYATPPGGPTPSERVCWWDDKTFMQHLWLLFSLPSFKAIVTFGEEPVIDTDRKKLAARLHQHVEESFIPML
jgi:1-acyl-sn-glycerol-3-phosphate acyltransferase